jgi:hypothetical protein
MAIEAKGSALDMGQVEQVIEKNILPAPTDNRVLEVYNQRLYPPQALEPLG